MISFDVSVSGDQVGRALANDPEELAYALKAMSEWDGEDLGAELAFYLYADDAAGIAAFLRFLAEKIEPVGAK